MSSCDSVTQSVGLDRQQLANHLELPSVGAVGYWIKKTPIRKIGTRPDSLGRQQPIFSVADAETAKANRLENLRTNNRGTPQWKSHPQNFTSREAAKEIGVSVALVNELASDGVLESEGEWHGYTGQRFRLLKSESVLDVKKRREELLATRDADVPNGRMLIEKGAETYGLTESFIRTKVFHDWETASKKLPSKKGVVLDRVLVREDDLISFSTERRGIRRAWRGKVTIAEFAQQVGESEETVYCWIYWEKCPTLHRKLNAEKIPRIVSTEARSEFQHDCWAIDADEVDRVVAVKRVWHSVRNVAEVLEIPRSTLSAMCRNLFFAPLALRLTSVDCRLMGNVHSPPAWHLHASLIAAIAKHKGKPSIADEYSELAKRFGKLAEKALDHCRPESTATVETGQTSRPQKPAPATGPADDATESTPKSKGGRPRKWDRLRDLISEMPEATNADIAAAYRRRFASPIAAGTTPTADANRVRIVKSKM